MINYIRVPIQHPEEFNKLMVEVNQLNIVRESNSHLRSENEELSKKLQIVTNQLHIAQDAGIPLEEAVRKVCLLLFTIYFRYE